jgi:hypothetical protein
VYAYWHFDDFSWGETRKIQGEDKEIHGTKEGVFDSSQIEMRKWSEFERDRRALEIQLDREYRDHECRVEEERVRREAERANQEQQQAFEDELAAQDEMATIEGSVAESDEIPPAEQPQSKTMPEAEENWEAIAMAGMVWSEAI